MQGRIPAPPGIGRADPVPGGKDGLRRRARKSTAGSADYTPEMLALDLEVLRSSSSLGKSVNDDNMRQRKQHEAVSERQVDE